MSQADALDQLSFAPRLRPFYAADASDYGDMLSSLVTPGDLLLRTASPQEINLKACKLLGGGVMTTLSNARALEVHHKSAHVVHEHDDVLAMIALQGSGVVTQQGQELKYGVGDITFRKANMPSVSVVHEHSQLIVFRLSKERFFGAYADLADTFVPCIGHSSNPMVEQVRSHIERVFPEMPALKPASVFLAEQSLIALFGAIYCDSSGIVELGHRGDQRWSALTAYVNANLGDAEMTVDKLAKALGISKRLLHRLFETRGTRYGQYLLQRRLERARCDLSNEKLASLTVAEIGFRCGFNDPSHFSRAFRLAYGASPRVFRATPPAGRRL